MKETVLKAVVTTTVMVVVTRGINWTLGVVAARKEKNKRAKATQTLDVS